jgi:hypothetical protein
LDPRLAGSKPAEENGFLKAIKILSTPSFGGEVKPLAACRKILQHVKNLSKNERDTSQNKVGDFLSQVPPNLLLDEHDVRIARELWWTKEEFSPIGTNPPWFSMLSFHLENE